MYPGCRQCGLRCQRESGYFLGSIYINYGLTALLVTLTFFLFFLGFGVSPEVLVWPLAAFCILFAMWFHRYARSLWLGLDVYFDPVQRRAARELSSQEIGMVQDRRWARFQNGERSDVRGRPRRRWKRPAV